jgi:transcriptional regulator with XRE-family HTH domain
MRAVGDRIGVPAATVSQVEKGERAVKEPKIATWAAALDVEEADLRELWLLSQGLIDVEGAAPVFYETRPAPLFAEPLGEDVVPTVDGGPDLEPIYRVADRIRRVLRRLLPDVNIWIGSLEFEPTYIIEADEGTITPEQQDEDADAANAFLPLPLIEFGWSPTGGRPQGSDTRWDAIRVPLLQEFTAHARRRSHSVKPADLESLVRKLSGPERERVRGYVEAILEERAHAER